MRIFVISLKSAKKRRTETARQLARFSLDFEFFNAVERVKDAFRHFDGFNQRLYKLNTGRSPLRGEIGCYASHKALWKTCIELNEPIIILEDDFLLADNFAEALPAIESLTNRFGFVRLQSFQRAQKQFRLSPLRSSYRLPEIKGCRIRYLSNVPLCLLAYAINPDTATALVRNSNILSAPVDKFIQKTWTHTRPIFALEEPIVSPSVHADDSTIGGRHDKSRNVFFLLERLIYKGIGEFQRSRFDRAQLRRLGIPNTRQTNGDTDSDARPLPALDNDGRKVTELGFTTTD